MSAIKSVVKYLSNRFLTKEDLLPELLAKRDIIERADDAVGFFMKQAPLLPEGSRPYNNAVKAAEDLLVIHYKSTSFSHLCRSQVRRTAKPNYYTLAVIGQVIEQHVKDGNVVEEQYNNGGGEAGRLLSTIKEALVAAAEERNPIKRRSIVRKAISVQLPGLTSDRLSLLVELTLAS